MKTAVAQNKDAYSKLVEQTRQNLGRLNRENTDLRRARDDLQKQLETEALSRTGEDAALQLRVTALEAEKAGLEQDLAGEKEKVEHAQQSASLAAASSSTLSDHAAAMVSSWVHLSEYLV